MILLRDKYTKLPWTKGNVDHFKSPANLLRHARTGKDIDGIILIKGNSLVGYIAWSQDSIIALEVMPEYRNQGIATQLLSQSPVQKLTVQKTNKNAIKLYENLGYKVVKENSRILYMEK